MSKIKTVLCFLIIVGLVSASSVTANVNNTNRVTTQLEEQYLEGYKCLTVVGPNFDPFSELLFSGKWENFGGTFNRTGPISPIIDRFDNVVEMDFLCDEAIIADFDLIWLPGEYHDSNNSLSYYPTAITLIIDAYNEGLIFAALNMGQLILATADIISGKNIAGPNPIQSMIEAAGANFFGEEDGIQTDLPFVTCTGFDEPYLIYAAAAALGIDIPIPEPSTPTYTTSTAAIHLPSLLFILGVSLFAILFKKKQG